jgi:hypothetical protein
MDGLVPRPHRAGQRDDRHAAGPRAFGDDRGRLPMRRLPVHAAFRGDDQIRPGDRAVQPEPGERHLLPGPQPRAQHRMQPGAEPARGPAARQGREPRCAEVPRGDRGKGLEPLLEHPHHRLGRALLRPEAARDAGRAGQQHARVAGDLDRHGTEPRVPPGRIDARELRQRPAARRQHPPSRVEEAEAERPRHAHAGIVRAAVTAADQDAPRAAIERGADQLADAGRAGAQRVARIARHQPQAGRRGHFDDGGAGTVFLNPADMAGDRRAKRAGHRHRLDRAAAGACHRGGEALAAIHHGAGDDPRAGAGAAQPGGDRPGHLGGMEAFLVARGRDKDPQRCHDRSPGPATPKGSRAKTAGLRRRRGGQSTTIAGAAEAGARAFSHTRAAMRR